MTRKAFLVTIDLDPTYGSMHTPENVQANLYGLLDNLLGHYNPTVTLAPDELQPSDVIIEFDSIQFGEKPAEEIPLKAIHVGPVPPEKCLPNEVWVDTSSYDPEPEGTEYTKTEEKAWVDVTDPPKTFFEQVHEIQKLVDEANICHDDVDPEMIRHFQENPPIKVDPAKIPHPLCSAECYKPESPYNA